MKVLTEEEVRAMEPALVIKLLTNLASQIPNERMLASDENARLLTESLYERLKIPLDTVVMHSQITGALYERA